jgi:hypothetical protein
LRFSAKKGPQLQDVSISVPRARLCDRGSFPLESSPPTSIKHQYRLKLGVWTLDYNKRFLGRTLGLGLGPNLIANL